MKFLVYIFLFFLSLEISFAQEVSKKEIFKKVDVMPEYPGGFDEMTKFLQKNIVFPVICNYNHVGGKVFLRFVIDENGKTDNIVVVISSGFKEMDDEAARVIKSMPNWEPGKNKGERVSSYYNLPINFGLNTPFFMYNVFNSSENYKSIIEPLQDGNTMKVVKILESGLDKDKNIDVCYNLGVAYFHSDKPAQACEKFKQVLSLSAEKTKLNTTILDNCKSYLEKYCTN